MKTYHFDEETKIFTHEEDAFLDPLESKLQEKEIYLLPANATFDKPDIKEGFAAVWGDNGWEYVEDHRDVEYWLPEDSYMSPARKMEELGPLPEGAIFTAPEQSIESVREEKIAEFKSIRDERESQPVEYDYHFFDYDEKARDRINGAIIKLDMLGPEVTIDWTSADDEDIPMTANDLRGVISAVADRSNLLHIQYRQLRDKVNACEDIDEIKNMDWDELA